MPLNKENQTKPTVVQAEAPTPDKNKDIDFG